MWWRFCAEGNVNTLRFLYELKSLWGERFQDMKIFMQKTLWGWFFSQRMPPPLWLGFCAPPAWWDTKQEHHLTALPCAGHICREGFAFSRRQEASVAAVTLSEGPGARQGAPRVDYTVFMAVLSWWSSIKIREHREGLRPMDCSSLPSSRDNFNPSKCIKQMSSQDRYTHWALFSKFCLSCCPVLILHLREGVGRRIFDNLGGLFGKWHFLLLSPYKPISTETEPITPYDWHL